MNALDRVEVLHNGEWVGVHHYKNAAKASPSLLSARWVRSYGLDMIELLWEGKGGRSERKTFWSVDFAAALVATRWPHLAQDVRLHLNHTQPKVGAP